MALLSCKKIETEKPETGVPVFFANGYWDQQPVLMQAGEKDVFMFTDFHPDSVVLVFKGALKKTCLGCNNSLSVAIRNYKTTLPGQSFIGDSAFHKGNYVFYHPENTHTKYGVQFTSFANGPGVVSHAWGFGDGTFATEANPYKIYEEGKTYQVTYVVSYSGGCSSGITYDVNSRNRKNARFTATQIDTTHYQFSVDSPALSTVWDLGDSNSITGNTISHTYSSPGRYRVCVIQYTPADTFTSCQQISVDGGAACNANYHFVSTPIPTPGQLHLSEVTVEWTDEQGITYSSAKVDQDSESYFRILESGDYVPNIKNQRTRRMVFETHCRLSNGSQIKNLHQVKGVIAVGLP